MSAPPRRLTRSMPSKAADTALRDILHHIELATSFSAGFDRAAFGHDLKTVYAVTRCPVMTNGRGVRLYCTLSATKRSSPSAFETKSSTDFLPSFFNWSTRFLTSAALLTASCATSTITSPTLRRLSAASEVLSTLVMMTPLTLSLNLYRPRRSLERV